MTMEFFILTILLIIIVFVMCSAFMIGLHRLTWVGVRFHRPIVVTDAKLAKPIRVDKDEVMPIGTQLIQDPFSDSWYAIHRCKDGRKYVHRVTNQLLLSERHYQNMYEVGTTE